MSLEKEAKVIKSAQDAVDNGLKQPGNVDRKGERTSKLKFVRLGDLPATPPSWLINGVMEEGILAMMFGDPGVGKSFLAISMACCIATGTDWYGHEVRKGLVLYIAGEGHSGIRRRADAWGLKHCVEVTSAPLHVSVGPVALSDHESLEAVSDVIKQAEEEEGEAPQLVIIDTLARNFGSKDENSTKDMQEFISVVDELRLRHECTILIVHHTGHAEKGRARGAIALQGAVDVEYRVSGQSKTVQFESTKMKDGPTPSPLKLKLDTVKLPELMDEYDKTATSAVFITIPTRAGGRRSE